MMFVACACDHPALLTSPGTWGQDFTERSPATDDCPGGTLSALRSRMAVHGAMSKMEITSRLPEAVRMRIEDGDEAHAFRFEAGSGSAASWGFEGVVVVRGDCIVHAEITGRDN